MRKHARKEIQVSWKICNDFVMDFLEQDFYVYGISAACVFVIYLSTRGAKARFVWSGSERPGTRFSGWSAVDLKELEPWFILHG